MRDTSLRLENSSVYRILLSFAHSTIYQKGSTRRWQFVHFEEDSINPVKMEQHFPLHQVHQYIQESRVYPQVYIPVALSQEDRISMAAILLSETLPMLLHRTSRLCRPEYRTSLLILDVSLSPSVRLMDSLFLVKCSLSDSLQARPRGHSLW